MFERIEKGVDELESNPECQAFILTSSCKIFSAGDCCHLS